MQNTNTMQNLTRDEDNPPGLGEQEATPGGGLTVGDAVPEMPPGSDPEAPGGGLTADDVAQPTSSGDATGDRATGLTGLRG